MTEFIKFQSLIVTVFSLGANLPRMLLENLFKSTKYHYWVLKESVSFKNGPIPASFCLFSSFSHYISTIQIEKA